MKGLICAAASIAAAFAIATFPLLCLRSNTTLYACAETSSYSDSGTVYARANSRDCYFCTSQNLSTGLFAVPYTYCVEVLGEDGDWYSVKYAEDYGIYRALYGYVLKENFTILVGTPETTYLYKAVSVTFSQNSASGSLPVIDDITVTAAFYGSYYSGAAGYSYVLCQGSFGYISGANEDYPLISAVEDQPKNDSGGNALSGSSEGKIIAVVALAILAALALALIIISGRRPRKRRRSEDTFAGEQYRR